MKTKLKGFRELEKALAEEMPKATAKNTLRRTAVSVMKRRIEARAKQLAPVADVDGGQLRDSITTKTPKAKRVSQTRFAKSSGVEIWTGPTGREEGGNAAWQEFGTAHAPAQPYMRPAADTELAGVLDDLKDELTTQIGKAKDRIARKAARGN